MRSEKIVLNEILYSSVKWSKRIKRGQTIQLKALDDNASLSAMFYNSSNVHERFNSADTVKVQWNAFWEKIKFYFLKWEEFYLLLQKIQRMVYLIS